MRSRGERFDDTTVAGALFAAHEQCFGCHEWDTHEQYGRIFRRSDGRMWHTTCWFGSDFGKRAIAAARAQGDSVDDDGRVRVRVRW